MTDPSKWRLIEIPTLTPRAFPAVSVLNQTEIVIMGGRGAHNYHGDVIVFDTETEKAEQVVAEGDFEFQAYGH